MPSRTALVAILLPLLAAMPTGLAAQVYKWTDEKGVVNYGDKPPPSRKSAQPLSENGGSVSVVPGMSRDEMEQVRQRDMQRRVRQLEEEVDELRARAVARDTAVPYPVPADVYVPAYAYGYDYGYGYGRRRPPIVGHPGHRPEHPIATPAHRPKPVRSSPVELMPNGSSARGAGGRG